MAATPITVVQDVREMRGETRSRLMRADDANFYVVKFQNNPLGRRALVNDYIASKLAAGLGLAAAGVEVVQVSKWMLGLASRRKVRSADAGPQFGSRFVSDPMYSHVVDYFPQSMLTAKHVANLECLAGGAIFGLWMRKTDHCQFVYHKLHAEKQYTATMIDQTGCFGGVSWKYRAAQVRVSRIRQYPLGGVRGEIVEHWVTRIAAYPEQAGLRLAGEIPGQWMGDEKSKLIGVLEEVWRNKPSFDEAARFLHGL